ncbi:MAG: PEP-utilizing enzyme [Desulfobacterales bacterium]|nr:PEP-utilizing enzyme [Desulfobacterales bacterium]
MEDPYLRERGQDIKYIYNRLIRIMVKGKESVIDMQGMRGKVIIVAHDLSPADTIQLNLNRISGFTTDVGGRTSHTSIIARALEIPAVVGVGNITSLVKNNDNIIVDGDDGVVIINPTRRSPERLRGKAVAPQEPEKGIPEDSKAQGRNQGWLPPECGGQH